MPDKKSVVGQNNNELWHHLCPDEEKVWCAFPPSLSHMFFFISPSLKKKYQQNVDSWNERGKGKLMVSFFFKEKNYDGKNQLFDFFKQKNWLTNKRTNAQRIRLQSLFKENLYFLIYSWFFLSAKYLFSFLH